MGNFGGNNRGDRGGRGGFGGNNRGDRGGRGGFGGNNRGNRGGYDRGGRGGFGGGRDSGRPQMHSAVCAECGQDCEVPFKPSGDKPVLCRECFNSSDRPRGNDNRGGDRRNDSHRNDNRNNNDHPSESRKPDNKEQLEMMNIKLDRILKILSSGTFTKTPTESVKVKVNAVELIKPEPAGKKPATKKKPTTKKTATKKAKK